MIGEAVPNSGMALVNTKVWVSVGKFHHQGVVADYDRSADEYLVYYKRRDPASGRVMEHPITAKATELSLVPTQESKARRVLETFLPNVEFILGKDLQVGDIIKTPRGLQRITALEPDDERVKRLIYVRTATGHKWTAELDGEVTILHRNSADRKKFADQGEADDVRLMRDRMERAVRGE